ncbi:MULTISPECIES: decarboxylase [unclassified Streptomyces]|uniref:maleate cis-trans isomerase family protein n=1 Tax=unclassified Streptomyces TaxID=2593676 RepID=UPI002E798953|nr:decarboxylase [Streptomyces sp. JV176]MEE1802432.1 aspartate/glutamate racemase family protein [Streptomyces sp. JV176]
MDVSFLGGPQPQRGVGVVAPFDFALDRELWRWVPDNISLRLTRTPYVPVEVSLDLARLVSEHETLGEAVRALGVSEPEVVAYACTSGSFVGGPAGERAMCEAMTRAGEVPSLTTTGALVEALEELGVGRIALVTPYTESVTQSLEEYLAEVGVAVTGRAFLGLTRDIWKVPYRSVMDMARQAVVGAADALFISCTNLPTYDVIPQLEAELGMPVLSANQVTMWAALRRLGAHAVGPYQALLLDPPPVQAAPPMTTIVPIAPITPISPMTSIPPVPPIPPVTPISPAVPNRSVAPIPSQVSPSSPVEGLEGVPSAESVPTVESVAPASPVAPAGPGGPVPPTLPDDTEGWT